jgi:hypothetical protein
MSLNSSLDAQVKIFDLISVVYRYGFQREKRIKTDTVPLNGNQERKRRREEEKKRRRAEEMKTGRQEGIKRRNEEMKTRERRQGMMK